MSEAGRFSTPVNFPSLLGVYLAVNAVRDAYVLVDGPDCALYKAHFIHGRHDLNSTLLRVDGRHRVAFTNVCARGVVKEHDSVVEGFVRRIAGFAQAAGVLVTAMPMCSITGADYGRVLRERCAGLGKPAADIPPASLTGDWLEGYEQALLALARTVDLPEGRRRPGTAAIVGCLRDRNEGDHDGNRAELARLLEGAGLELVSTWLDGGSWADLSRAAEAEVVVSLPHGRRAARAVAERTGAALVEAPLPFGLPRSAAFVRAAARASGMTERAERFVSAELSRAARRLQWLLPHLFLGRSAAFVGEPRLLEGFLDIAEDCGLEVAGAVATGRGPVEAAGGARVLLEPPCQSDEVQALLGEDIDLLVSCRFPEWRLRRPFVEFGFPSTARHALDDRPYLGFRGCLAFVERLAESLARGRHG